MEPIGWGYQEPAPETPAETPAVTEEPKDDNFTYFPDEQKKEEVIKVKGKG